LRGKKSTEGAGGGYKESLFEYIKNDISPISKKVSKEFVVFLDKWGAMLYHYCVN
jgi:hypothetical protein